MGRLEIMAEEVLKVLLRLHMRATSGLIATAIIKMLINVVVTCVCNQGIYFHAMPRYARVSTPYAHCFGMRLFRHLHQTGTYYCRY